MGHNWLHLSKKSSWKSEDVGVQSFVLHPGWPPASNPRHLKNTVTFQVRQDCVYLNMVQLMLHIVDMFKTARRQT